MGDPLFYIDRRSRWINEPSNLFWLVEDFLKNSFLMLRWYINGGTMFKAFFKFDASFGFNLFSLAFLLKSLLFLYVTLVDLFKLNLIEN